MCAAAANECDNLPRLPRRPDPVSGPRAGRANRESDTAQVNATRRVRDICTMATSHWHWHSRCAELCK